MNKNINNNPGYILVLTLMLLSVLVIVVTNVFFNETGHSALTRTVIGREKAKMLALSGVQLAFSKLSPEAPKKEDQKKKEDKKKKDAKEKDKKSDQKPPNEIHIAFLKKILPILNGVQKIKLTEETDGVSGEINISIAVEEGKINLNELYNFANHKFISEDAQKFLQNFMKKLKEFTNKDLFGPLQQYLQKRTFPLNDVTELLEIPEFEYFRNNVFYDPFYDPSLGGKIVYLTDIFTTWTKSDKLQPWLFSHSVSTLFGLKKPDAKNINVILKNFKDSYDWKTDWNKYMQPVFGKNFDGLIKDSAFLLNPEFNAKLFSITGYGTVGEVTQKIFAIVEIKILGNNEAAPELKKLYWI